jgi:ABC-2 type transport system ATP-binding protein
MPPTTPTIPIIEAESLTKVYRTYRREQGLSAALKSVLFRDFVVAHAITGVSFTIDEGEMVAFVGANGAGKSTTMKILTGVLVPTAGTVRVLGFVPWKQRRFYTRHIGAVFGQKSQLWWDLPPVDAFHLNKDIYRIADRPFKDTLGLLTEILRLGEVIHRPTRSLSLGERMKCELVLALLHQPPLLFLDEPTIGIDAMAKDEIRELFAEINRRSRTTILLTTHDMEDVEEICRRLIVIDHGRVIFDGQLAEAMRRYSRWKVVDLEISAIKDQALLDRIAACGTVLTDRPRFKSIRFAKETADVPRMVAGLISACEVIDLTIHEPKLEQVIREIYRQQESCREAAASAGGIA